MKKSRAETSGTLSGEFADRVRPPYASDEKRRQAAELFEHGIGYQRASRILDLPPIRCGIGPEHGVRGSSAPPSRRTSIAIRMLSNEKPCACAKKDTPGMRLRKLRGSVRAPASGGWINSVSQHPRAVRMKSDPKRRIKISGNDLQARGWGSQGQGPPSGAAGLYFFVQQDDFGSVLG